MFKVSTEDRNEFDCCHVNNIIWCYVYKLTQRVRFM